MFLLNPELAELFLFIGAILIIIEIALFTIGVLGILGVGIALLGTIGVYTGETLDLLNPSNPWVISVYLITALTLGLVTWLIIRAMRKPVETGKEAMIGENATILEWKSGQGRVSIEGESWIAIGDKNFKKGDTAIITAIDKLTLTVSAKETD